MDMALTHRTCAFGVQAKQMLEAAGFEADDRILSSRPQVERFKTEQELETTPQSYIDGERIGGCEELQFYLAT